MILCSFQSCLILRGLERIFSFPAVVLHAEQKFLDFQENKSAATAEMASFFCKIRYAGHAAENWAVPAIGIIFAVTALVIPRPIHLHVRLYGIVRRSGSFFMD